MEERKQLRIVSLLPAAVETLEEQVARCINQLDHFNEPINKYSFLRNLMEANSVLFYAVVLQDLHKSLPVIYTPTVGEACQNFSHLYALEQGLFIKASDKDRIADCLAEVDGDYDIIVITDGSRILGLGDLGANGMGIPIGKCSLYVAGAGIAPHRVLPMCLDVGTNNEYFLKDPQYVGLKQKRCDDELFYALLDEFMTAAHKRFPKAVVQFEDFSNNHCFDILARYRDQYRCFNDDIQGTGIGLGATIAEVKTITSDLMTRAAITLADMVPEEELENGLYPGLSDIRRISAHIAAGVADEARLKGIANATTLPENSEELVQHMASSMWNAEYGSVL
eukprot:gene146-228_t